MHRRPVTVFAELRIELGTPNHFTFEVLARRKPDKHRR